MDFLNVLSLENFTKSNGGGKKKIGALMPFFAFYWM